jgi:hypothetical protein
MRKCRACGSKIETSNRGHYCKEDENKTCFDNNGGMKRRIAAEKAAATSREKTQNFLKTGKYKETVTNTFVCESEGCGKTYQITRKKWTSRGVLSNPNEKSRFKFCSVKCSRDESARRNQVAKQQNPNNLGLDINGNPRLTYDKNGNYPTATCPYCQETFERRFGHRQKVCQNAECQRGWKLFQSSWNRLYGSIKDWPPLFENDINKREYSRTCKQCEEVFTFRAYPDANGNPIASAGKREFCSYRKTGGDQMQCFDVYYRTHLSPEQYEKYRASANKANKKGRDNLEDWYVKGGIQQQLIRDGFHIPINELCQSMIDDKKVLLAAKRAYAKATGQNIQRSSYR